MLDLLICVCVVDLRLLLENKNFLFGINLFDNKISVSFVSKGLPVNCFENYQKVIFVHINMTG